MKRWFPNPSGTQRGASNVRRHAFTLVELLVVVAIMSLLVALLIPALSEARYLAKKTACGSNLRGFGQAMKIYSSENENLIPLTYWSNSLDQIQVAVRGELEYINHSGSGSTMNMYATTGRAILPFIVPGGDKNPSSILTNPKILYCPLQTSFRTYNDANNPWPPVASKNTYIDYGTRPMMNQYVSGGSNPYNMLVVDTTYNSNSGNVGFPKTTNLSPNLALLSDYVPVSNISTAVSFNHVYGDYPGGAKAGINVYYNDDSVEWVNYGVYKNRYKAGSGTSVSYTIISYTASTGRVGGFWGDFDRNH